MHMCFPEIAGNWWYVTNIIAPLMSLNWNWLKVNQSAEEAWPTNYSPSHETDNLTGCTSSDHKASEQ